MTGGTPPKYRLSYLAADMLEAEVFKAKEKRPLPRALRELC